MLSIQPCYVTTNPGQHSLLFSVGWENEYHQQAFIVLFGWEGKHGSAVMLAICHKHKLDVVYPSTGLMAEARKMSTRPVLPCGTWHPLPLLI